MIITIEGVDRSGKSTQAAMLLKWMHIRGYTARLFEFPDYTTDVGREILYHLRSDSTDHTALHTLMARNRLERLQDIQEAVPASHIVMDRYCESNLVYGIANGLDRRWLASLDSMMPGSDMVILLDVDPARSFRRREDDDAFESDHNFIRRVAQIYRTEAEQNGWLVVDGDAEPGIIHDTVAGYVADAMHA